MEWKETGYICKIGGYKETDEGLFIKADGQIYFFQECCPDGYHDKINVIEYEGEVELIECDYIVEAREEWDENTFMINYCEIGTGEIVFTYYNEDCELGCDTIEQMRWRKE